MEDKRDTELNNILEFMNAIDYDTIRFCISNLVEEGKKWDLYSHSHDVIEMVYLIDAKAYINTLDKTLHPTWCDMVVYPPHHVHQEYIDMNYSQKCMYIRFDVKSKVNLKVPFQVKDIDGKIYWLLSEIVKLSNEQVKVEHEELILTYIKAILLNMKMYLNSLEEGGGNMIDRATNYIRYNYAEDINVHKLANMFYVSPSYISRVFQKKLGISPMNYVAAIRIEAAKKLLCFSDTSVNDIAAQVGVEDPKYFSRLFKKVTDYTPTEYRRIFGK